MARRKATNPVDRENQLIAAAVDLAEKQLREGTASTPVIVHYLRLGSTRERAEQEKIDHQNRLYAARVKQIDESKKTEELYRNAIEAMRRYSGTVTTDADV